MKNMSRARRRADLRRMKRKARAVYPHDKLARAANHLAVCSGPCCGNPRRHFGQRSQAELAALDAAIVEFGSSNEFANL